MKQNDDIELAMEGSSQMDIDFSKYWRILKDKRKHILIWTLITFVIGCLIAIGVPRKYKVVSKIAPELSSTATTRLSTMAALTGLSSTVLGSTDAVYPMVYPDIVKSPAFIADLFGMPVETVKKGEVVNTDLYGYITDYHSTSWLGFLMSLPVRLISLAMDVIKPGEEEDEDSENVDPFHFTRKQGRAYRILSKSIEAAIDRKTLVLTTVVTMQDAQICADLSKAVNENLKKYVTSYRTQKAIHDQEYYEKLYGEAQESYYSAQRKYSSYVDRNQGIVLQSVKVEEERLRNEMNLQFQLYNTMAQQLQNAKAKVQQETPVFVEVVNPSVPLRSSNSRKKIALVITVLGFFVVCAETLVRELKER